MSGQRRQYRTHWAEFLPAPEYAVGGYAVTRPGVYWRIEESSYDRSQGVVSVTCVAIDGHDIPQHSKVAELDWSWLEKELAPAMVTNP